MVFQKSKNKIATMQKGDVHKTHASTKKLNQRIKFVPKVQIKEGIKKFVDWYISYYKK